MIGTLRAWSLNEDKFRNIHARNSLSTRYAKANEIRPPPALSNALHNELGLYVAR
jgi:hypothetical protein